MDTTTILPTPPTSGAIVQSNGYNNDYLAELITNNNVADNSRAILGAISSSTADIIANEGVHSVAALNAINLASVSNLKATGDASVAGLNGTNLASVANLEATNRNGTAINKNIYDGVVSNMNTTNLTSVATQKAVSDAALTAALSAGEIRELINKTAFDNTIAIKENGFAIREEGCKTREEVLKGNAAIQLEACKNTNELAKEIAKICCCVNDAAAETRMLILTESTKRLEAELQEARLKAAIAGLGNCDKGGGK